MKTGRITDTDKNAGAPRNDDAQLPWNHNNHDHIFLLTHGPNENEVILDIGYGAGEFASRLAQSGRDIHLDKGAYIL